MGFAPVELLPALPSCIFRDMNAEASMRTVHDAKIELRAAGVLVEGAKRAARRRGMTLSEFMRDAMRRSIAEAA